MGSINMDDVGNVFLHKRPSCGHCKKNNSGLVYWQNIKSFVCGQCYVLLHNEKASRIMSDEQILLEATKIIQQKRSAPT